MQMLPFSLPPDALRTPLSNGTPCGGGWLCFGMPFSTLVFQEELSDVNPNHTTDGWGDNGVSSLHLRNCLTTSAPGLAASGTY